MRPVWERRGRDKGRGRGQGEVLLVSKNAVLVCVIWEGSGRCGVNKMEVLLCVVYKGVCEMSSKA